MIKRMNRALMNKSGASILIVLSLMTFLFALAGAALTAASAGAGTTASELRQNQMDLYLTSLHKVIMSEMLSEEEETSDIKENRFFNSSQDLLLKSELLRSMYVYAVDESNTEEAIEFDIDITLGDNYPNISTAAVAQAEAKPVYTVTGRLIPNVQVREGNIVVYEHLSKDGTVLSTENIYIPEATELSGIFEVTVEVRMSEEVKRTTAVYELSKAEIETNRNSTGLEQKQLIDEGTWSLVSYE